VSLPALRWARHSLAVLMLRSLFLAGSKTDRSLAKPWTCFDLRQSTRAHESDQVGIAAQQSVSGYLDRSRHGFGERSGQQAAIKSMQRQSGGKTLASSMTAEGQAAHLAFARIRPRSQDRRSGRSSAASSPGHRIRCDIFGAEAAGTAADRG